MFIIICDKISFRGNSQKKFRRCCLSCSLHCIQYTLYIYISAYEQLRRHLLNHFREFPCIFSNCSFLINTSIRNHIRFPSPGKIICWSSQTLLKTILYLFSIHIWTKGIITSPVTNSFAWGREIFFFFFAMHENTF